MQASQRLRAVTLAARCEDSSTTLPRYRLSKTRSLLPRKIEPRENHMGEIIDKVKGKAKQVEGIITGDKARQNEGKLDEAKGKIKGVVNRVEDAVEGAVVAVQE